jgi:hypothetical protein
MLSEKNKKREEDVIEAIPRNNGYYINNAQRDKEPKPSTNMTVPNGKKHITFTYNDPAVRMITKLFRIPPRRPGFATRSGQVGFVVYKVALGQVLSEYFGFPCQPAFHQILHYHNHPGQVQ